MNQVDFPLDGVYAGLEVGMPGTLPVSLVTLGSCTKGAAVGCGNHEAMVAWPGRSGGSDLVPAGPSPSVWFFTDLRWCVPDVSV